MIDNKEEINNEQERTAFSKGVGAKIARKLKVQSHPNPGVWFGLGMTGLIGWSVVVTTLLGTALGIWLDKRYPGTHSWTLTLLISGLVLGCLNAWHWVSMEDKAMREGPGEDDE